MIAQPAATEPTDRALADELVAVVSQAAGLVELRSTCAVSPQAARSWREAHRHLEEAQMWAQRAATEEATG